MFQDIWKTHIKLGLPKLSSLKRFIHLPSALYLIVNSSVIPQNYPEGTGRDSLINQCKVLKIDPQNILSHDFTTTLTDLFLVFSRTPLLNLALNRSFIYVK